MTLLLVKTNWFPVCLGGNVLNYTWLTKNKKEEEEVAKGEPAGQVITSSSWPRWSGVCFQGISEIVKRGGQRQPTSFEKQLEMRKRRIKDFCLCTSTSTGAHKAFLRIAAYYAHNAGTIYY